VNKYKKKIDYQSIIYFFLTVLRLTLLAFPTLLALLVFLRLVVVFFLPVLGFERFGFDLGCLAVGLTNFCSSGTPLCTFNNGPVMVGFLVMIV
jgi:hypothetical protein